VKNTGFTPGTPLKNGGIFIILPEFSIAETRFLIPLEIGLTHKRYL
jgi:hypothetical protein